VPDQLWLFPSPTPSDPSPRAPGALRLSEARGVSFFDLPCRSVLNRCASERMPFEWTINPYRGCEFGCTYCYARYSHEYLGMEDWVDFQDKIFVKREAARRLARELPRALSSGGAIALGTVTDPYQPAEREHRITRRILEVLARARGLRLSITTKSTLVARDLDLLRVLASRGRLTINVSLITLDRRLARILEPRAPTPEKRLGTIRTLSDAGLRVGVFAMPVLPGLTDSPRALEELVRRSAQAGAAHFAAQLLFLRGSARRGFLMKLEKDFPALARRYRRVYRGSAYAARPLRDQLALRVAELTTRYGLTSSGSREHRTGRPPADSPTPFLRWEGSEEPGPGSAARSPSSPPSAPSPSRSGSPARWDRS
jgi:DNA repair photolyase